MKFSEPDQHFREKKAYVPPPKPTQEELEQQERDQEEAWRPQDERIIEALRKEIDATHRDLLAAKDDLGHAYQPMMNGVPGAKEKFAEAYKRVHQAIVKLGHKFADLESELGRTKGF